MVSFHIIPCSREATFGQHTWLEIVDLLPHAAHISEADLPPYTPTNALHQRAFSPCRLCFALPNSLRSWVDHGRPRLYLGTCTEGKVLKKVLPLDCELE